MDKFSALADPTRRSILEMLARQGQLSATTICEQFHVSPPAISQHLKILREANLVRMEKRAQQRMYEFNPESLHELEVWTSQMLQLMNERFEALDALLEVEKQKLNGSKEKPE
jgi:DNA-binding transcriptional ArsR family regulator